MARQTKLGRLMEGPEYADLQDILAQLEARMERTAQLEACTEMDDASRLVLLSQAEGALASMRWALHNSIRRFVWELERL